MSESSRIFWYSNGVSSSAVALPFDRDAVISAWAGLRARLVGERPDGYSRDEWAYLLAFLSADRLRSVFGATFGAETDGPKGDRATVFRPRREVGVWLPNNVSLLGPLALVMLSLTGVRSTLKLGSRGEDLTGPLLELARHHLPAGDLVTHLRDRVELLRADPSDPKVAGLARRAAVRIVFGSDSAATEVDRLEHPVDSFQISFRDRRSEAWIETGAASDEVLRELIKVFAVYGPAGCTSPRRVVLIGGTLASAKELRDRLCSLWPKTVGDVAGHVASTNLMGWQWARVLGWDARLTERSGAVVAVSDSSVDGSLAEPGVEVRFLSIVPSSFEQAIASLPPNAQTLGCAFEANSLERVTQILARTQLARVVPIRRMHEFGAVWDGVGFWRAVFEETEVSR
ncbi:MAG: hypothetical protein HY791_02505 [Deltaproteobacteria bacterium]|nr:hypothetical protein [Deltaproteobacteria bacterium]